MNRRLLNVLLVAPLLALAIPTSFFATASPFGVEYVGGGVAVIRADGDAPVDDGALVCDPNGRSVGGACLPWGGGNSILVTDLGGSDVAYQACVDHDGDGFCRRNLGNPCGDDLFFSHSDGGAFYNPLGPLPVGFKPGCPGGFPGWVVFLCTGVHEDGFPHEHAATWGFIQPTMGGTGYGNFCGPNEQGPPPGKKYVVV